MKDLSIFCNQFHVLFGSGISIFDTINILQEQTCNKKIKNSLSNISLEIQKGSELSDAMRRYIKFYPTFMLNMIKIGEESGRLEEILESLANYYQRESNIRGKLKSAMAYPVIIFIITSIISVAMIAKVVPIYTNILIGMGAELPFVTRIIISISGVINNDFFVILIILLLCIFSVRTYVKTPKGKYNYDSLKLHVPIISKLYTKALCSKFSRCMSVLISSGITLNGATGLAIDVLDNTYAKAKLKKIEKDIEEGINISKALTRTGFFPRILISMVSVGEETGRLDEMLNKSAEIFESEVSEGIEKVTVMVQPAMILLLSAIVGVIILSIMLPMYSIMDNMG